MAIRKKSPEFAGPRYKKLIRPDMCPSLWPYGPMGACSGKAHTVLPNARPEWGTGGFHGALGFADHKFSEVLSFGTKSFSTDCPKS